MIWKEKVIEFDKDYVEILFLGDIHYGNPKCDLKELKRYIEWVLEDKVHRRVVGMGDYIENVSLARNAGGTDLYTQTVNPTMQMDYIVKVLKPVKEQILGMLTGNHELRTMKGSQIDLGKIIADSLEVDYLGYENFVRIQFSRYKAWHMYVHHGDSGAANPEFEITKYLYRNGMISLVDVIAIGHCHALRTYTYDRYYREKTYIKLKKVFGIRTGSFLNHPDYAKRKGYKAYRMGAPILRFSPNSIKVFEGLDEYD